MGPRPSHMHRIAVTRPRHRPRSEIGWTVSVQRVWTPLLSRSYSSTNGSIMTSAAWSHHIDLTAAPRSAAQARDFVTLHLIRHQLLYMVEAIRLVASELATNALLHTRRPFTLTLEGDDRRVLLRVRDGLGTTPVVMNAAGPLEAHGRGLSLVADASSDWGVDPESEGGGKSVWASWQVRAS